MDTLEEYPTMRKFVFYQAADKIARQMICSNFFRTGLLPNIGLSVATKRHCIRRLNSASCRIQWLSTSEIPVAVGLDVCVDLTGSSPLTQTGMVDFVPGRAVIDAAQRKRDAVTLLKRIRKFSMAQDIEARAAVHIFNMISFAIVKGFGVEYSDDYDDKDKPIPFRRRVFPSCLDGKRITRKDVEDLIESKSLKKLDDDDAVSLCCICILQLVLLGLEDRRAVPNWILRLANDRDGWDDYPWGFYVWHTLYYQLRDANVKRWFPYMPLSRQTKMIRNRIQFSDSLGHSRIVVWHSNKEVYRPMPRDFLHGRVPAERLIPDEVEAGSGWWLSTRAYFDGCVTERERRPPHLNRQNHYEVPSDIYRDFQEQRSGLDLMLKTRPKYIELMKLYMEGRVPTKRLIPDEVEAGSGWWLSSRGYFDGCVTEQERRPPHLNRQNHYEVPSDIYRDFQEQRSGLDQMMKQGQNIFEQMKKYMEELNVDTRANREPIIADQHYGISDLSGF
ncbi:phospholipase-like protein [Tanacetum coccineum]